MEDRHSLLWMWARLVCGSGFKTMWKPYAAYGDIEKLTDALMHGQGEFPDEVKKKAARITLEDAAAKLETARQLGQRAVCWDDEDYPESIRELDDAPPVLFCRGEIGLLRDRVVLDVVGTREPSEYSEKVCGLICRGVIGRGALLANGFAEGIDRLVCRTSLEEGSAPVVFYAYPLEHGENAEGAELMERAAQAGVVISEYCPGEKPVHGHRRRNRLTIAVSSAVLMIEAGAESRGLDHWVQARRQHKPTLAVPPGDLTDSRYDGQRKLLRQGCRPLFGALDVVYALEKAGNTDLGSIKSLREEAGADTAREKPRGRKSPSRPKAKPPESSPEKESPKAPEKAATALTEETLSALGELQSRICKELMKESLRVDELSQRLDESPGLIMPELTELELGGLVRSEAGGYYSIASKK